MTPADPLPSALRAQLQQQAEALTRIHAGCLLKCTLCEQTEEAILSALIEQRALALPHGESAPSETLRQFLTAIVEQRGCNDHAWLVRCAREHLAQGESARQEPTYSREEFERDRMGETGERNAELTSAHGESARQEPVGLIGIGDVEAVHHPQSAHAELSRLREAVRVEQRLRAEDAATYLDEVERLREEIARLTAVIEERDHTELSGIAVSYATPVDHFREMARRFSESRDELKHKSREQSAEIERLKAENERLEFLLTQSQPHVCSLLCPSTRRGDEPWVHHNLCHNLCEALTERLRSRAATVRGEQP